MLVVLSPAALSFDRINIDTRGRANLVSGGVHLFAQRPVYGYGSGSFPKAYREHVKTHKAPVSVSHTEPITVAAEQGLVGLAALRALVVTALWTMAAGLRPSLLPIRFSRGWRGGGAAPRTATAGPLAGPLRPRQDPRATHSPGRSSRDLCRAAGAHDGLRRLLRGPDHLGPAGCGASLAAAQQRRVEPCPDTSAA